MLALVQAVATVVGAVDSFLFPSVNLLLFTAAMRRCLRIKKVSPPCPKLNKCSIVKVLNVDGIKVERSSRPAQRCKQSVCNVS